MHTLSIKPAKKLPCRLPNQATRIKIRQLTYRQNKPAAHQPVRIQKILSASGLGSRRHIEAAIFNKAITVNGQIAQLGQCITPSDHIMMDNKPVRLIWSDTLPRIILYNKPEGEIVTRKDPSGRVSVFDRLPQTKSSRWISIGRLDLNSCGLLILTTHGGLAHHFMHPRFEIDRKYAVRVLGILTDAQKKQLYQGIMLPTGLARVVAIQEVAHHKLGSANKWYHVTLKEGKNREVRALFAAIGLTVSRLIRIQFGPVVLPTRLKCGQYQELNAVEVANILKWAKFPIHRG
ncbi:MAG: rRNA pseudouridine synthase [Neisseriales bacterium]|nr:MAG: rRNA pseudouridine synthase [Neisseriales bacterium]